jgi:hypothetical protein
MTRSEIKQRVEALESAAAFACPSQDVIYIVCPVPGEVKGTWTGRNRTHFALTDAGTVQRGDHESELGFRRRVRRVLRGEAPPTDPAEQARRPAA